MTTDELRLWAEQAKADGDVSFRDGLAAAVLALIAERDELGTELAEIAELAGPGGDGTAFGRVESAFSGFTARAEDADALANERGRRIERLEEQCAGFREQAFAAEAKAGDMFAEAHRYMDMANQQRARAEAAEASLEEYRLRLGKETDHA